MAKHVIFLGAGASWTSGYPLAADLRFILSSPERFRLYLNDKIEKLPLAISYQSELKGKLEKAYASHKDAVRLFRDGGFATVDEFSYLARERHEVFVQTLKRFTSAIFSIHNPEHSYLKPGTQAGETTTAFLSSDYFPFIQKLFDQSFHDFKSEVAVFTYNYDAYLEFLLSRAYKVRKETSGEETDQVPSGVLSGFGDLDAKKLLKEDGFCFLKLHGTSVLPGFRSIDGRVSDHSPLTFSEVFEDRELLGNRLLAQADFGSQKRPPIIFPWELIQDNGEFVSQDKFGAAEGSLAKSEKRLGDSGSYYEIFKAIWQRAQNELVDAEKISFVGLSMHEFLKPGLKFLFSKRIGKFKKSATKDMDWQLEISLACPGAWASGDSFRSLPRPNSPPAKLAAMLADVNPNMAKKEKGQVYSHNSGKKAVGGINCYDCFKDFIEAEM
jgi:hypothetical protein